MEARLFSINELSIYINIKPQTIRNKLSSGTFPIPPVKIGGKLLWDKKRIDRYLDRLKPLD